MEQDNKIKTDAKPPQTMVTSLEIEVNLHSEIKVFAAKNRMKIKDVVNNALKEFIESRKENNEL